MWPQEVLLTLPYHADPVLKSTGSTANRQYYRNGTRDLLLDTLPIATLPISPGLQTEYNGCIHRWLGYIPVTTI